MHIYILSHSLFPPFVLTNSFLSSFSLWLLEFFTRVLLKNLVCILCDRVCVLLFGVLDSISCPNVIHNHINATHARTKCTVFFHSFVSLFCLFFSLVPCLSLSLSLYLFHSLAVSFSLFYTCLKNRFQFTRQDCTIYCCSSLRVMIWIYWSAAYVTQFDKMILIKSERCHWNK